MNAAGLTGANGGTDGGGYAHQMPASLRPVHAPVTSAAALAQWLAGRADLTSAGDLDVAISGITLSTERVCPGDLYAALPGARAHGADFAATALERGAVAVLTDAEGAARLEAGTPALIVDAPRTHLGALSARVYGDPTSQMSVLGVTGTQGKTTTTRLLSEALHGRGVPVGVIGTVGTRVLGEEVRTSLTTPEAPDLQGLFASMVEAGVEVCAMEVSSHALVLGRVDGVRFDVATFLNLGRDHLDFHADIDDYFAAKASLFTPERARVGVANADDEFGRRLAAQAPIEMHTYALHDDRADWRVQDVALDALGSRCVVRGPDSQRFDLTLHLPGEFNVSNALAALATAALGGLDPAEVAAGMAGVGGVPGRLERVDAGQDFAVVVDYAHKPDAVRAVLESLRPLTDGQLIVVIGAGGDRDPGKRVLMGAEAARVADLLVVTDDNPRTEDPAAIRAEVLRGTSGGSARVVEVGDRREAIAEAVRAARPGDVVLIAGKGHESGQEIAGVVHPFDDRVVAREELAAL